MALAEEVAPAGTDSNLTEFLDRRFIDVSIELSKSHKHLERREMPYKPENGDLFYFGDPANHSYDAAITVEGFWGKISTGWTQLG